MSKKKTNKNWGGYKQYTLTDGTRFLARDDSDAKLYREKVGDKSWNQLHQTLNLNWKKFERL